MNNKTLTNVLLFLVLVTSIINGVFWLILSQRQNDLVETIKPVVSVANADKYNRDAWCYEMRAEYRITQEEIVALHEMLEDAINGNKFVIKQDDLNRDE